MGASAGIVFDTIVRFNHKAGLKSCMRAAFCWSHDRASCQPGVGLASSSSAGYTVKSCECFRCLLLFVFHSGF